MSYSVVLKEQISFLQDFIKATDPDLGAVPEEAGPLRKQARKLYNRLRTPVRIIVTGEFSAGKSTLTNLLVGRNLIPTSVLASELPPVLFRFGQTTQIAAGWWDQKKLMPVKDIDFDAAVRMDPDFILVTTPNPFLKGINIFDSPGTSDPLNDDSKMQHLIRSSEATIWCTNAVQAWRESERYTWSSLPAINRKNSILVVTHIDLPAVRRGMDRVMRRIQKEAGDLFRSIVPVAAPRALKAAPDGVVQDREAWKAYGGEALFAAIKGIADPIRKKKLTDAASIIETRFVPFLEQMRQAGNGGKSSDTPVPVATDAARAKTGNLSEFRPSGLEKTASKARSATPENPLLDEWATLTKDLISKFENARDPEVGGLIQSSHNIVMEMTDRLTLIDPQTEEIEWITNQFQEALDQLTLMQLETGEEPLEATAILLLQLSRDLEQATTQPSMPRVS